MHDREATSGAAHDEYRRRSSENWDAAAAGWEAERERVAAMARPLDDWLVGHLDLRPGLTVLEVGAGPGGVGLDIAPLLEPGGHVISSDRSRAMGDAARRLVAERGLENVSVRTLDAESIELANGSVDRVLSRLAHMLVPDPGAAFAEVRRVLRPGGRLACIVWDAPARNPWATALWDVLETLTALPPAEPGGPGMFALADTGRLGQLVAAAGLDVQAVDRIPVDWEYPDFDVYWGVQTTLNGGLARLVPTLPATERASLERAVRAAVEPFRVGEGYRLPGTALGIAADAPEGV